MTKRVTLARPERAARKDYAKGPGGGSPPKGGKQPPPAPDEKTKKENRVDELLASAAGMTSAERKELLARLSLAEQGRGGQEREPELWSRAVYEALVDASGTSGEGVPGPVVIRRLVATPSAYAPVAAFMSSSGLGEKLDAQEHYAFFRVLACLLVEDAERVCSWSGAPMGAKAVAQRQPHVRGIFDKAFPSYVRSGLALVVARRLISGALDGAGMRDRMREARAA